MDQSFAAAWSNSYIEVLRNGGKLLFRRSGKIPVKEFFFGVLPGIGTAVTAKHLGRIVGRIEADAEKMGLLVERRISGQSLIDFGKVMAHPRAEIGKWAAGIDEGEEQNLALELRQVNGAIALVEELEIGHNIAGLGNMVLDGRFVVRARLGRDNNVVEQNIAEVAAILVGENGGRDAVTGMKFRGDDGVLEFIGHGHRIHEAGNGLPVESDVGGIGADDLAADVK